MGLKKQMLKFLMLQRYVGINVLIAVNYFNSCVFLPSFVFFPGPLVKGSVGSELLTRAGCCRIGFNSYCLWG